MLALVAASMLMGHQDGRLSMSASRRKLDKREGRDTSVITQTNVCGFAATVCLSTPEYLLIMSAAFDQS